MKTKVLFILQIIQIYSEEALHFLMYTQRHSRHKKDEIHS